MKVQSTAVLCIAAYDSNICSSEQSFNAAMFLIGFRSGSTTYTRNFNNGTDCYSKSDAIL